MAETNARQIDSSRSRRLQRGAAAVTAQYVRELSLRHAASPQLRTVRPAAREPKPCYS